ncbi:hypothetical protein [Bacillus sp. Marseille-Q3570]|uniref:hypothetical protein n=1 Tax=Bacillus sp. Marseille-Q3570 TaxID=2963522 RepID=UPI0021B7C787|nr:hypothetical protein [Bacillus sp. Marseille-Q3570]
MTQKQQSFRKVALKKSFPYRSCLNMKLFLKLFTFMKGNRSMPSLHLKKDQNNFSNISATKARLRQRLGFAEFSFTKFS